MDRVVKVDGNADAVLDAIEGKPEAIGQLRRLIEAMSGEERRAMTLDAFAALVMHQENDTEPPIDEFVHRTGEA